MKKRVAIYCRVSKPRISIPKRSYMTSGRWLNNADTKSCGNTSTQSRAQNRNDQA